MTTQEVANALVDYCRRGEFKTAIKELYAQDIVSYEPQGSPAPETKGWDNVWQKTLQWEEMTAEVHSATCSDPIVSEDYFSVTMTMDVTFKNGHRSQMSEVCVYGVRDGKIWYEQFFFTPVPVEEMA